MTFTEKRVFNWMQPGMTAGELLVSTIKQMENALSFHLQYDTENLIFLHKETIINSLLSILCSH